MKVKILPLIDYSVALMVFARKVKVLGSTPGGMMDERISTEQVTNKLRFSTILQLRLKCDEYNLHILKLFSSEQCSNIYLSRYDLPTYIYLLSVLANELKFC